MLIKKICRHCKKEFEYELRGGQERLHCSRSCKDMAYQQTLKGRTAKKRADYRWRYSQQGIQYRLEYNCTTDRIMAQRETRWRKAWGGNAVKALERDGYKCVICGNDIKEFLTINHKIPRNVGGTNDLSNLSTLCANCHHFLSVHQKFALAGKSKMKQSLNWELINAEIIEKLRARYAHYKGK